MKYAAYAGSDNGRRGIPLWHIFVEEGKRRVAPTVPPTAPALVVMSDVADHV